MRGHIKQLRLTVVSKYIKPVTLKIKYCIKGLEKGIDDR